jgi:hypothetical protein
MDIAGRFVKPDEARDGREKISDKGASKQNGYICERENIGNIEVSR